MSLNEGCLRANKRVALLAGCKLIKSGPQTCIIPKNPRINQKYSFFCLEQLGRSVHSFESLEAERVIRYRTEPVRGIKLSPKFTQWGVR